MSDTDFDPIVELDCLLKETGHVVSVDFSRVNDLEIARGYIRGLQRGVVELNTAKESLTRDRAELVRVLENLVIYVEEFADADVDAVNTARALLARIQVDG